MQKKIIALAVAGLASTAAFAQTNVTVYGIADAGYAYVHSDAAGAHGRDTSAIISGGIAGSRLGFKGTEDLGNGLKAVFVLEQGFNIDNGTVNNDRIGNQNLTVSNTNYGSAFQRQAFVGLSSAKAGTLTLGRQYAPGYYAAAEYDPLLASPYLSPMTLAQGTVGATIIAASSARWNNTVNYATPNFAGFTGQVIYRFGEQTNELNINNGYALGLKYAGGPVSVSYVFHHTESSTSGGAIVVLPTGTVPGTTGTQDEHFIGLSFDAKVAKIFASAQMSDIGDRQFAGKANRSEVYTIGTIVPVGKGNIHASYARADLNGAQSGFAGARGQVDSAAIAYSYGLSKRTTLYTGLNYTDKDNGRALLSIDPQTGVYGNGSAIAASRTTTFAAGINHQF